MNIDIIAEMKEQKHIGISCFFTRLIIFLTILTAGCQYSKNTGIHMVIDDHGAIIRTDTTKKIINLVFTAHDFVDGFSIVNKTLDKHNIKATFFFTGDCYRNPSFKDMIETLISSGHYLGAHSDKHLLYCTWEDRDSLLVSREEFDTDLQSNYHEMKNFGIAKEDALYYMPPYEWYNKTISNWTEDQDLKLVNFSPGTYSNGDWTYPELGDGYYSSDFIFKRILDYESKDGMNGFILLTHIGTDPRRTDKLYNRLDDLITELKKREYVFKRLDKSLGK